MALRLRDVDLESKIEDEETYDRRLEKAQLKLLLLQRLLRDQKQRVVVAFEGWDAAGKGGTIKRLVERLDPRGFVVHPIAAPEVHEQGEHYLQRFWRRLPRPGSLTIFDRTWYGRVLVERVERLCTKEAWKRAYDEINEFERMLVEDGVPVLKFFLHISKKEQKRRFEERAADPFTVWKLTDEDWRNRAKWDEYEEATDDLLERTDTKRAPWHVVPSEYKWFARVQVVETCVAAISEHFGWDARLPEGWRKKNP